MFSYGEISPPRSPLTDSLAPFYTVGRWSQPRGGGDRNEKNWGCLWGYYPLVMSNIAIENDHRNSGFTH